MAKVTGLGGVFFKSDNQEKLLEWYKVALGIDPDFGFGKTFKWDADDESDRDRYSVWSIFPADTKYFEPSQSGFMINFRVDDLDAIMEKLMSLGANVVDMIEEDEYGRFGWVTDPEGNKIELWEPKSTTSSD